MQTAEVQNQEPQLKAKRTRKPKSVLKTQEPDLKIQEPVLKTQPASHVVTEKKERVKRKKRIIDPNKMTYIKAFQIWRQKQDPIYVGLSPKKGSKEYDEIMQIMKGGVQ